MNYSFNAMHSRWHDCEHLKMKCESHKMHFKERELGHHRHQFDCKARLDWHNNTFIWVRELTSCVRCTDCRLVTFSWVPGSVSLSEMWLELLTSFNRLQGKMKNISLLKKATVRMANHNLIYLNWAMVYSSNALFACMYFHRTKEITERSFSDTQLSIFFSH